LRAHGLDKHRSLTVRQTAGALAAVARVKAREVRSFESAFTNGLWHL
jgi:hypothetical protein